MVQTLKRWWGRVQAHSWARFIFSRILGFMIPYTGTVKAVILELKPGFAAIGIKDRRGLRNHLASIHALALANLGELTTGLALHFSLKDGDQAILTKLEAEYHKKARGFIIAKAHIDREKELIGSQQVLALLYDHSDTLVCTITATWLVRSPTAKALSH